MSYFVGVLHVNLTIEEGPEALETARRFYVDLLGLEVLYRSPETDHGRPGWWLSLGPGGQQIHISAEQGATGYNRPSRRHSAFGINDLGGLRGVLEEAGVVIDKLEPTRFFCRDPFGNRLEFIQASERQSAVDILANSPGLQIFKNAGEVTNYLQEERDSWER